LYWGITMNRVCVGGTLAVLAVAIFFGASISNQASAADLGKGYSPKEVCICGYNTRIECDGTYMHYISDYFDENSNYCGYDDQATGDQCSNITRNMKRITRPMRPAHSK
jgi:hypothetical protein